MLKRRSGEKYFGISLPYIPEGYYIADIIAYIRKKIVRSTDQITKPAPALHHQIQMYSIPPHFTRFLG